MTNRLIQEHRTIWREFHAPSISLRESKDDWRELLKEDPTMSNPQNWGEELCGLPVEEIEEFKQWMEGGDD